MLTGIFYKLVTLLYICRLRCLILIKYVGVIAGTLKVYSASDMLSFFFSQTFLFWYPVTVSKALLIGHIDELIFVSVVMLAITLIIIEISILHGSQNTSLFTFCYFYDTHKLKATFFIC
jgi:hypothetical protein